MRLKTAICGILLLLPAFAYSFDLWSYPEAAEENAIFLGGNIAALSFSEGFVIGVPVRGEESGVGAWLNAPEVIVDYMLPFGFPLSLGLYMAIPNPNLKHFGLRAAYHFDIHSKKLDIYFLYAFDFGFLRNDLLEEYNDTPVEMRYYDFRAGVRYIFAKYIALCIETGYKLECITFGIAVKIM